jgi:DeoR/GlpR family transcriptional regulator of sugar metabolism
MQRKKGALSSGQSDISVVMGRFEAQGLLAETRRKKIVEWLQEEGSVRVRNLAEAFSVTEATIRQDLEKLETENLIVREHGGAYLKSVPQQVRALALHHLVNMDEKRRIGRAAAALVQDGDTVILDSGSTTTEIANNLLSLSHLNVITNALNIALILGATPNIAVHMTGGHFKPPTLSLTGEKAAEYFNGIYAGKLFLATAAISFEAGLTYPSMADLHVKKAMVKAASHVYLVADSTKIGQKSFSSLGGVELIHTLITDTGITDKDRKAFERAGVEVMAV